MIDTVIRNPIQIHEVDGCNYILRAEMLHQDLHAHDATTLSQ